MMIPDVPSPIDLRLMSDASEWEAAAMQKRPWRAEFFAKFADELMYMESPPGRVLELGSGPGFLAHKLLTELSDLRMTLLDFSEAMHSLARRRLGHMLNRVEFLVRSFKESDWFRDLNDFDAVVTNQAVHELRHKRYAEELHRQVARVLRPGGTYLVCDHFFGAGGMTNDQLYLTAVEQQAAIDSAGYRSVRQVLLMGGLVMHRATTAHRAGISRPEAHARA
ncbi:MAG: methyltransferase domain-containing protein [Steroidobacteraceae bacterium]|jgi:ubiquinone/menaquinone biosynthesis C-methylase UbiE